MNKKHRFLKNCDAKNMSSGKGQTVTFSTCKKKKDPLQSGVTIVEMLFVIAVLGVITIDLVRTTERLSLSTAINYNVEQALEYKSILRSYWSKQYALNQQLRASCLEREERYPYNALPADCMGVIAHNDDSSYLATYWPEDNMDLIDQEAGVTSVVPTFCNQQAPTLSVSTTYPYIATFTFTPCYLSEVQSFAQFVNDYLVAKNPDGDVSFDAGSGAISMDVTVPGAQVEYRDMYLLTGTKPMEGDIDVSGNNIIKVDKIYAEDYAYCYDTTFRNC